jgi:hypothetical protein
MQISDSNDANALDSVPVRADRIVRNCLFFNTYFRFTRPLDYSDADSDGGNGCTTD